MKTLLGGILALYVFAILVATLLLAQNGENYTRTYSFELRYGPIPDFSSFTSSKEKKKQFFGYFRPIIENENKKILQQRAFVARLEKKHARQQQPTRQEQKKLNTLSRYYKISETAALKDALTTLKDRVNIVPTSLALAQAANESAWGTSRFAVQGNNYFGQWCFQRGCGLVPKHRSNGANHEVRVFDTPAESVRAYIRNINTHAAYTYLRQLRGQMEDKQEAISGAALAQGLKKYSERGEVYIHELQAMITSNRLE